MVNVVGLVVLVILYLLILIVGILASWKIKVGTAGRRSEMATVAGRKLNGVVGVFTMAATTVGGGYINGTAESVATSGLAWTLVPPCILIGLIIGGVAYAGRMRERAYLTMLQPIEEKCGRVPTLLVYLASICGDVLWTASILTALGTSLSVIVGLDVILSIILSASIAVCYTFIGQMISVAYTDVVQLNLIAFGLILSTPYVVTDPRVSDITETSDAWVGAVRTDQWPVWADLIVAMSLGTIPWQAYFQRVLSVQSSTQARVLSIIGALVAFALAFPPVIIGMVAVSAGLGAITAAVMSSVDSSILASSSLFTHNVYKTLIHPRSTDRELLWTQRCAIVLVGALSTTVSLLYTSVYDLFVLSADVVFVTVLPQLTCALYLPTMNAYGSIAGFLGGLLLRLGAGEPAVSFPAFISYPLYNTDTSEQLFPFRTFSMLVSVLIIIIVSVVFRHAFAKGYLPKCLDIFEIKQSQYRVEKHDVLSSGGDQPLVNGHSHASNESYTHPMCVKSIAYADSVN